MSSKSSIRETTPAGIPAASRRLPAIALAIATIGSASLIFPSGLLAQTTSDDSTRREDDVVSLSPFEVSTDADVGYVATNSLAGSRLNTPLKDTAASISVMTKEFLDDLGAVNLEDAMAYANNVQVDMNDDTSAGGSPNDNSTFEFFTNFRVRGIKATVTRNYFPWRMPNDSYNIDRIEEQRGPNSILFGVGSAGGIINTMTKRAVLRRDFVKGSAMVGSYNRIRGTIDVNQSSFNDKFAVRFNAAYDDGDGYREHEMEESVRGHLALQFQPFPNTSIRAEFEKGNVDEVVARTINILDGFTDWLAAGKPTASSDPTVVAYSGSRQIFNTSTGTVYDVNRQLHTNQANGQNNALGDSQYASPTINTGGPSQTRTGDFEAFSAFVEQRLGQNTFLELAYNRQRNDQESNILAIGASDGATLYVDLAPTLAGGVANPNYQGYYIDGQWGRMVSNYESDNVRLSLSTELDYGKWGNYRFAVMGEYEDRYFFQQQQRENFLKDSAAGPIAAFGSANNPANSGTRVYRRAYFTEGDWSTYWVPGPATTGLIPATNINGTQVYSGWVNQSLATDVPEEQMTALIGGQARYFDGRVIVGFGLRKDELDFTTYPQIRNDGSAGGVVNEIIGDKNDPQDYSYSGVTKTYGVVGHVTSNLSVFYNYSTNFSLPNTGVRILPDSGPADSPEGQGTDMGFSFDLIEGKLSARVAYFFTDIINGHDFRFGGNANNPTVYARDILDALVSSGQITDSAADARRLDSNGATFTRRVEGYELNLTANPTRNWRLNLNYSITDGFETNIAPEVSQWFEEFQTFLSAYDRSVATARNNGQTIAENMAEFAEELEDSKGLEGRALPGNRREKVSVFTRYTFRDGLLKGVFVGGGVRHNSKLVAGVSGTGDIQYGNSYSETDFLLGYEMGNFLFFKSFKVQLNVNNALDDTDPIITRYRDDGTPWRLKVRDPRSFRLTANFEF